MSATMMVDQDQRPVGPSSAGGDVWVDPARITTRSERIGGLPVVNAVLRRLGLVDVVASYLDPPPMSAACCPPMRSSR